MEKKKTVSRRAEYCLMALFRSVLEFRRRALPEEGEEHDEWAWQWLKGYCGEATVRSFFGCGKGGNTEESSLRAIFCEALRCIGAKCAPRGTSGTLKEIPLLNPFSRVRNPHQPIPSTLPDTSYLPLPVPENGTLKFGWHVPVQTMTLNTSEDYRRLWSAFETELELLKNRELLLNVDALLHLLDKYTSCMPSVAVTFHGSTGEIQQGGTAAVSLFDHARSTAAIMFCLLDYYTEKYGEDLENGLSTTEIIEGEDRRGDADQPFLLVGGDLSGVQRFIYTITSKGALKSLKGRSFFLELLIEHTVDRILEKLELFRCNVVFTGGGHFYLICPNTQKARQVIEDITKSVNDFLRRNFAAALELFICCEPFSKAELTSISDVWRRLSERIEAAKKRPWEGHLAWFLSAPGAPHPDCYTAKCEICGREDAPLMPLKEKVIEEIRVCKGCREQFLLGEKLQKAARSGASAVIYRWDKEPQSYDVQIDDGYYRISGSYGDDIGMDASAVYHLNEWNLNAFCHKRSRPMLAGIYVPPDGNITDLEAMVDKGYGMDRLGVLRMDVDRLGRIFSQSVPENERSFALMATLSRRLSLFFKYHLNGILEGREGYPARTILFSRPNSPSGTQGSKKMSRLVSVVYSGGDDLFLMGHWLDVLEAALDIQKAFQSFTANPFITLSGGLIFAYPHDPVYRLAELAGRAEEEAKSGKKDGPEGGRRSLAITENYVFPWKANDSDVEELCEFISRLRPFMKPDESSRYMVLVEGGLSMGFMYRLLDLMRRWRKFGYWVHPKLAYLFGRTRVSDSLKKHLQNLRDYVFSTKIGKGGHIEAALMICLMMLRKRSDES